MRVMVIVKANKQCEAGVLPSAEMLAEMGKYNEGLLRAGVMLTGDGLRPSSKGARVKFGGREPVVTNGPFPETEQLVAGFWIWKVKSQEEAVEWLKKAPFRNGETVEIRQFHEAEDFAPVMTPEAAEQEARRRQAAGAGA